MSETSRADMTGLVRRAYFDCVSCAEAPLPEEYQVHRADRLRMIGGELWCEDCYDAAMEHPNHDWREIPAFDPTSAIERGKAEAVAAERERCAKIAEGLSRMGDAPSHPDAPKMIAVAIRGPEALARTLTEGKENSDG